MTRARLEQLHRAAKAIHYDGTEGIQAATAIVGEDVAIALAILNMRFAMTPPNTFPSPAGIEGRIDHLLQQTNVLQIG